MTTWIEHVKAVYSKGKGSGMKYKDALRAAAKTWKKGGKASKSKAKAAEPVEVDEKPKKKRRRRRKPTQKVPAKAFKDIDSINMPKKM